MKESKPIFIVYIPISYSVHSKDNLFEQKLSEMLSDYNVIAVPTILSEFKFELFNPNIKLTGIDIEELKTKLLSK